MISIQDTTGTLSAADLAALRTHQAGLSCRILVTAAGSRAELDAAAGRLVTSSDGIGIALDPVHHQVYTHFGVGTGIALLLTGMLIGEALEERRQPAVVEREVIRETPRYDPPSSSYDSDSSSSFDSGGELRLRRRRRRIRLGWRRFRWRRRGR